MKIEPDPRRRRIPCPGDVKEGDFHGAFVVEPFGPDPERARVRGVGGPRRLGEGG